MVFFSTKIKKKKREIIKRKTKTSVRKNGYAGQKGINKNLMKLS